MTVSHRTALFFFATLGLSASAAHAQSGDSAVAQALFDQAKALMSDGHVAEACPKLEESQRLEPRSGTQINLASCYEQTGRLASAWSMYIEAATAAKASGNTEREAVARDRASLLAPRLPKLTIVVAAASKKVAGLEITRDGVIVREPEWGLALPCDPGEHEVTAKAPDRVAFKAKVTVSDEGSVALVKVPELTTLTESPSPAAPVSMQTKPVSSEHGALDTQRTAAIVAGAAGVVGVGLGAGFGLASKSKHDEAAKYCDGAACSDNRGVTAGNAAQNDGNISTVMMIIGGVGLATGVTLWLTAPKTDGEEPSVQVGLGFGSLRIKGAF